MLEDQLFKYYKAADESTSAAAMSAAGKVGDSDMKGCISIQGCKVTSLAPVDAGGKSFCFQLTPLSNKIFLICAPSEEDRDQWIKAIQANAELRSGAPAPDQGPSEETPPEPQPEDVANIVGKETVTLADFELLKVIGRGTYGKVMQVRRRDTSEILAMKVLKKENIFARNDPKDLQHTISERNVLALVNNEAHPFILGLRYAFHTPAKLYYVLNFCNGGDLYYLLSRCKKFKEQQARFYASEVFLALQHLHKLGVIYRARRGSNAPLSRRARGAAAWVRHSPHTPVPSRCPAGDLKPENVLLDSDGHVKLTDFGLSKESPTADTFCGTPVYLAPEIWMRKTYGFEVDWWSLGCVLYEMVCGLPPFWGDTIKDVYKKVINSTPKFPAISPECQSVIEGLLQREPAARLGGKDNGNDIKEHEFFTPMTWEELLEKKVKPPFKSKSASQDDTNNFHKAFTNQKPIDSVTSASHLNDDQQAEFEGFTYIPEAAAGLTISDEATEGRRKSQYTQPRSST